MIPIPARDGIWLSFLLSFISIEVILKMHDSETEGHNVPMHMKTGAQQISVICYKVLDTCTHDYVTHLRITVCQKTFSVEKILKARQGSSESSRSANDSNIALQTRCFSTKHNSTTIESYRTDLVEYHDNFFNFERKQNISKPVPSPVVSYVT